MTVRGAPLLVEEQNTKQEITIQQKELSQAILRQRTAIACLGTNLGTL